MLYTLLRTHPTPTCNIVLNSWGNIFWICENSAIFFTFRMYELRLVDDYGGDGDDEVG